MTFREEAAKLGLSEGAVNALVLAADAIRDDQTTYGLHAGVDAGDVQQVLRTVQAEFRRRDRMSGVPARVQEMEQRELFRPARPRWMLWRGVQAKASAQKVAAIRDPELRGLAERIFLKGGAAS